MTFFSSFIVVLIDDAERSSERGWVGADDAYMKEGI